MSFIRDTRSVEQQHFFDGQRLVADDLQGIEAFNREMRWLHNQSLHQPGIGNGYAVAGKKGDREVTVGPGYAIDDLGREIVLTRDRVLPVPPVAGDNGVAARYLLTIAYPEGDLDIVEERQGVCADSGATRLRVEPVFCWQPLNPDGTPGNAADAIVTGRQLTVAEIAVKDCKLDRDVKISTRRNARPASQPYIYAGEEKPTGLETMDRAGSVRFDRLRIIEFRDIPAQIPGRVRSVDRYQRSRIPGSARILLPDRRRACFRSARHGRFRSRPLRARQSCSYCRTDAGRLPRQSDGVLPRVRQRASAPFAAFESGNHHGYQLRHA
ncbi:MAG: hypothetical protein R2845_07085 [Thermomicrobiales bacterium]